MHISVIELPTPELEFGDDRAYYADPRRGLAAAGPFSLRFGRAHKSQIRVGLVGPRELVGQAVQWYKRCETEIRTGKPDTPMYVDFPGFERIFQAAIIVHPTWQLEVDQELTNALERPRHERFERVLEVYGQAIERLARTQSLDVITCCVPHDVLANCWSSRRKLTSTEYRQLRQARSATQDEQLTFDGLWAVDDTPEELLQRDFRRALKARAMSTNVPIQIATPYLFEDNLANQDPATRAWNSSVALFYKAGGIPWRVRVQGPETCFVGLSFHYLRTNRSDLMYSSLAQAFSTDGEGFALKGESVPKLPDRRVPYLTTEQALSLGRRVLAEYRERTGREPARLVLHKTTRFVEEERKGFGQVFGELPVVEFVNIKPSAFRLVQRQAYPPKRGTLCRINDDATFLFTTGYIDEWQTYPGVHVPVPLSIGTDSETDLVRAATDVLALARMNWNTAFDTTGAPITLRFARQVGGIMAEVGRAEPSPSYRFYM
jgi:hypothetical protein